MILEWGLAALLAAAGFYSLGIWTGLGLAEDRAQHAAAGQLATPARPAAPAAAPAAAGPWRVPGYADPFPRPGRFLLDPGPFTGAAAAVTVVDMAAVPSAPHSGPSRPAPSPVDLDPAVRRLCEETQTYVANLIARSRHAERTDT